MSKRMTQKQAAANRANAQKSTGPRSKAGKAAARCNAIRHGHFAREVLLPSDSAAEFQELLDGVRAQLQPDGPLDDLIVQRLAAGYWRLRRAYRFEVKAIQELVNWTPDPFRAMAGNVLGMTPPRPNAIIPDKADLNRLLRYESLLDRELSRAMSQFQLLSRLRQAQAGSPEPATPPAAEPAAQPQDSAPEPPLLPSPEQPPSDAAPSPEP